jgi:hypothetical protein
MSIDWGTVSTSLLTSGGVLFAAYKLWFQRRLEDHKYKLQNNAKLFEIEMDFLKELAVLNQSIQNGNLGIRPEPDNKEIFIIKLTEKTTEINDFINRSSHIISSVQLTEFKNLLSDYRDFNAKAEQFKSPNTGYCQGRYSAYNDLPEAVLLEAQNLIDKTDSLFKNIKNSIFKGAGR